jgi:hypothetical protein
MYEIRPRTENTGMCQCPLDAVVPLMGSKEKEETYCVIVLFHNGNFLAWSHPAFWTEDVCVGPENFGISVDCPGIHSDDGLYKKLISVSREEG